jgi:Asp-tRNA(Asn)/Glu-tRNA(Gln) amidotransferase A subunit family amidase
MVNRLLLWSGVAAAGYFGIRALRSFATRRKWRLKAQAKKAERDGSALPKLDEVPEELVETIVSLTASELTAAIKAGKFSCRQVVTVYIRRAYQAGRELQISAEENFDQALEIADKLDRKLAETPEKCGKLFGVPISVKDQINQKGKTSSCGLAYKLDISVSADANVVRLLLLEDAIPIVRGNVPQGLMWIETHNQIYGRSMNPWDHTRSVGGSSGGDAALVASRSALIAIGTDIGGSIRTPSLFCGVSALKPTPERVSLKGLTNPHPFVSLFLIRSTVGPIARSVTDLKTTMECLWCPSMWDEDMFVWPLPFNHSLYNSSYANPKLRVGYFTANGLMTPTPPLIRAVKESVESLRRLGHEVVEIEIPDFKQAVSLYMKSFAATGSNFYIDSLQGEEAVWFNRAFIFTSSYPSLTVFLYRLFGLKHEAEVFEGAASLNTHKLTLVSRQIQAYKNQVLAFWEAQQLDVVISPPFGYTAPLHGGSEAFMTPLSYPILWNVLGFPAGVVPVSNVLESETHYESDSWVFSSHIRRQMKGAEGMPTGVQVAGLPNQDEKVLAVMKLIEEHASFTYL